MKVRTFNKYNIDINIFFNLTELIFFVVTSEHRIKTLQHRLVYPCIGDAVISVTQHCDKKPLEGYDNDSERRHRWPPIRFINEK